MLSEKRLLPQPRGSWRACLSFPPQQSQDAINDRPLREPQEWEAGEGKLGMARVHECQQRCLSDVSEKLYTPLRSPHCALGAIGFSPGCLAPPSDTGRRSCGAGKLGRSRSDSTRLNVSPLSRPGIFLRPFSHSCTSFTLVPFSSRFFYIYKNLPF